MASELEFERPILELRNEINELKSFMQDKGFDLSAEVNSLETKARSLEQDIYGNLTAAQKLQIARHPERPTTLDYVQSIFTDFVELFGDRLLRDDPAMIGGVARINDICVTVIGSQRGKDTKDNLRRNFGMAHPEGYRKAQRLMKQAEKFGRPVIAFVDTKGAAAGISSEERGISDAIAQTIAVMADLRVPTISLVTGEGGSGGAVAIATADRVLMMEHAWYSVIAPESAAVILWKDASQGQRAAECMRITAQDLLNFGIIDRIVSEPLGGAHKCREEAAKTLREVILEELIPLMALPAEHRIEQRYNRYRNLGKYLDGHGDGQA